MFNTASSFASGRSSQFAAAYRQIGAATAVDGATPHRLVAMLFDGYMDALTQARGAMRSGQIEVKCRAIARAVDIVDEGLRACLNMRAGGPLARDLNDLYGYVSMRLTLANLRNDEAVLDECQRLIEPLRQAWQSIATEVTSN